jgi:hypothetical protein
MRINNDSGTNYSLRYQIDNSVGSTGVNATTVGDFNSASAQVVNVFGEMNNTTTERKLGWANSVSDDAAGAGNAPHYVQFFYKWSNTSTQANRIDIINASTGDFTTGSEMIVSGND